MAKTFEMTCVWCRKIVIKKDTRHNRLPRFCSTSCSAKWRMARPGYKEQLYSDLERSAKLSAATKAHFTDNLEARQFLSDRMLGDKNPAKLEYVRKKISKALKVSHALGTKVTRGGNGTGMTAYEAVVLERFPFLVWNYAERLGGHEPGYPTHYKIDLVWVTEKIGVEIDGLSHGTWVRQAQDHKKEAKLVELGWTIHRVTNRQLEEDREGVLAWLAERLVAR